jgi:hypothetical protein
MLGKHEVVRCIAGKHDRMVRVTPMLLAHRATLELCVHHRDDRGHP